MRKTAHALAVPAVLLLAIGIAACGGEVPVDTATGGATPAPQQTPGGATPTDTPTPGATATPGTGGGDRETGVIPVADLQVGDCFNYVESDPEWRGKPLHVDLVSCDSPHIGEVYNLAQIDDSQYATLPPDKELVALVHAACNDAFETYVGASYSLSYSGSHYFPPTSDSWASGDRTIVCLITNPNPRIPLTGSARDAER